MSCRHDEAHFWKIFCRGNVQESTRRSLFCSRIFFVMNSLLNSAMMTERGQEMNASVSSQSSYRSMHRRRLTFTICKQIQSISTPPTSTEGPSAPPALSETPVLPPRIISAEERLAKAMIAKAADSYAELSQYWKLKGDVIITRWQETLIPDLRTVILLPFSALSPVTENTYPEVSKFSLRTK